MILAGIELIHMLPRLRLIEKIRARGGTTQPAALRLMPMRAKDEAH